MDFFRYITATVVASSLLSVSPAGADIFVDRIVAVAGKHAVTKRAVVLRAAPRIANIESGYKGDADKHAKLVAEEERRAAEELIDDALATDEASKLHLTVTRDEIDRAFRAVADAAQVTTAELTAEVGRRGLTMVEYRTELAKQLLGGKAFAMERAPRSGDTPESTVAFAAAFDTWRLSLRTAAHAEFRL